MEYLLRGFAYLIQIICILGLACILPFLLKPRNKLSDYRNKFVAPFFVSLLLVCSGMYYLARNPLVYCPPEWKAAFSEDQRKQAASLTRGLYSKDIPAVPFLVLVHDIAPNGEVWVETYYLFIPIKTTMVYGGADAPSIEGVT